MKSSPAIARQAENPPIYFIPGPAH